MAEAAKILRDFYLRKWKWKKYNIGPGFHAGRRVHFWARNLTIGHDVYIGRDSQIETDCVIGNYVMFGNKVAIVGKYDHNYQQIGTPTRLSEKVSDEKYSWKQLGILTYIEDDVWIGYGSIVLSGVTIKRGSIIAAGSLVTKDVEPFSIYAGNPAKKIGNRFNNDLDLANHIRTYESNFGSKSNLILKTKKS